MGKRFIFILILMASGAAQAYDPCEARFAFHTLAESQCHRLTRPLENQNQSWTLSAVKLSKTLNDMQDRDDVVLVPGGPGQDAQAIGLALNEKGMLDALWAHMNLNVVLFDPRGTGASLLPQSAEFYESDVFSTDKQVQDLKAVVDATSPRKPVFLLAHSAGGDLAAKYAALYPNRVKGLILYSASIDTREIGESNLRIFADVSPQWLQYAPRCGERAASLKEELSEVEFFLRNVLKLQRIASVRPAKLQSKFYLKDFRVELINAIENDPDCSGRVPQVLGKWKSRIADLPEDIQQAVLKMRDVKFDPATHQPPELTRGTWIKTAVICSEGITKDEMNGELWLEGLKFSQDTCHKVTANWEKPPSREWLKNISSPTLLIGGSEDPFQIPSAVLRNARSIPGSEVKMIIGGGHESHKTHPMEFYRVLENFFNRVRQ